LNWKSNKKKRKKRKKIGMKIGMIPVMNMKESLMKRMMIMKKEDSVLTKSMMNIIQSLMRI
jgi:hypothetical protein